MREWAVKMGVGDEEHWFILRPWMCGGFYLLAWRTGLGKHVEIRYLVMPLSGYAGECGRINDCCLIVIPMIPAWGRCSSGIAVEITKKKKYQWGSMVVSICLQMFFMGAVELSKIPPSPHEVVGYRWNWSLLKLNSTAIPRGRGGGGRGIHWLVYNNGMRHRDLPSCMWQGWCQNSFQNNVDTLSIRNQHTSRWLISIV